MLKLNTEKLHYAIKETETGFAFTRSFQDNITSDMKLPVVGVSVSAWFADSETSIIKDLKMCGFSDWDIYKAKKYMATINNKKSTVQADELKLFSKRIVNNDSFGLST